MQEIPAFFATLKSVHIGPNYARHAITFNDVPLNIGNGHNPTTGKFTAPVEGVIKSVSRIYDKMITRLMYSLLKIIPRIAIEVHAKQRIMIN